MPENQHNTNAKQSIDEMLKEHILSEHNGFYIGKGYQFEDFLRSPNIEDLYESGKVGSSNLGFSNFL